MTGGTEGLDRIEPNDSALTGPVSIGDAGSGSPSGLLDGFPVYGLEENGMEITNADLDAFHGHFGPTKQFPSGIYHYHFTDEDSYLNGSGYYGEKGWVTQ